MSPALGQGGANLLRNGNFQDDWLTLVPETKNHHWCYASEFYNRRDFNPDCWWCKGNWQWLDADAPYGQRRLVLKGPDAQLTQRVNWVMVHDSRTMGNLADAGGYPAIKPQRSPAPEKLVRELTFRVRLRGKDVPAKAGSIEVGLCPPGAIDISDPLGSVVPPTATAAVPLPAGSYEDTVLEVKLPTARWLQAAREAAAKGAKEQAEAARAGLVLPGTVSVAIRYQAAAGQVEVRQAELVEPGPAAPNLLPHGGFESTDAAGYPLGWEQPVEVSAPARPALLRLQHLAQRALRQPRPRRPGHGGGPSRPGQPQDDRGGRRRKSRCLRACGPQPERAAPH